MVNKLLVWAILLVVVYYVLVELPSPVFVSHASGVILISGASSGIGLDGAIALAAEGYTVFAGVRKEADGTMALMECNSHQKESVCARVVPVILDVAKQDTIDSTFDVVARWVQEHKQPFVALINNAGISTGGVVEAAPLSNYRNVFEVNYFGVVALTKKFLPLVRESKGRIVNVGSVNGVICNGGNSLYCSSKFALEGFTDSLRKEMLPLGVSVSLVNPGYIYTKIAEKGLAEIKHRQVPSLIQELYGRYYNNAEQRRIKNFQSGYTTEVTSEALIDAVKAPSPKTRYWVAGSGKMHASVLAFFARVVPTYLLDQIVERSTSEQ